MTAIFAPRNKGYYTSKHGRLLMSYAGRECTPLVSGTDPADQCRDRKPYRWTLIRFRGCNATFKVRPQDIREA